MNSYLYLKQKAYTINKEDPTMCLGQGGFGKVYKAYNNNNNTWVAIKQIDLKLLQEYGDEMKQIILNQINIMKKFSKKIKQNSCENLVKLYDCFRSDKHIYLVMQICNGGTLLGLLRSKKTFSQPQVIEITKQILNGLLYLQKMNITHRDFKPQNIFIVNNNPQHQQSNKSIIPFPFTCKIGDFGFSAQKPILNDIMGTYPYMAPQIFNHQQYTNKVDVWSLGITIHQLIFNQLYYYGTTKWEIQKQLKLKQQNIIKIEGAYQIMSDEKQKLKAQSFGISEMGDVSRKRKQEGKQNRNKQISQVFKLLVKQIRRCQSFLQLAYEFQTFQSRHNNNHITIFIQLYLLKFSYCFTNRLEYSLLNNQNFIYLPQQLFKQIFSSCNKIYFQQFKQLSHSVWLQSCNKFTTKYQQFSQLYLSNFKQSDKEYIQKAINNQPYESPIIQILLNEINKWINIIQNQTKQNKICQDVNLVRKCKELKHEIQIKQ